MFRLIREEAKVRNLRNVIFGLGCLIGGGFLANYFGAEVGAQQHTVERIWKAEDCKKISDGSGAFLYISGLLFEEGDKLKKEGKDKDSDESFEGALFVSQLSANYAKNYEVYCK